MSSRAARVFSSVTFAALLAATDAFAYDLPMLNGHATDPQHKMTGVEKDTIETKLGNVQDETLIDVAGWIRTSPRAARPRSGSRRTGDGTSVATGTTASSS